MTTAIAQPLTEADVLDLIAERIGRYPRDSGYRLLEEAIDKAFDVVGYIDLDAEGRYDFGTDFLSDAWADLTADQQLTLATLISAAKMRAFTAAWEAIRAEIVQTALAFVVAHPDAQRAPAELDR